MQDVFDKYSLPKPKTFKNDLVISLCEPFNEMRLIISHHLNKIGLNHVNRYRDGYDLLVNLREKGADIVMASINLKSMRIYDLVTEAQESIDVKRPPVLMLAPDLSREEVMYALELGINDILLKPFSYDQILPKIESAYGRFHDPKNPE